MKKIHLALIAVFIMLTFNMFGSETISKQQNENNIEFLKQLDANINGTLRILAAFNETTNKMPDLITGLELFSRFLMERTLDCSNLKKNIIDSKEMDPEDRETLIQILITTLNPEIKFLPFQITDDVDKRNREAMKVLHAGIVDHVIDLQKIIIQEEQGIIESETFNKHFFNLHSQHFVYQLLLDFMEPSQNLSKENRNYLLEMARALEEIMLEENIKK
jgi:hypothetical protein